MGVHSTYLHCLAMGCPAIIDCLGCSGDREELELGPGISMRLLEGRIGVWICWVMQLPHHTTLPVLGNREGPGLFLVQDSQ